MQWLSLRNSIIACISVVLILLTYTYYNAEDQLKNGNVITHYDTIVRPFIIVDTLVIIETLQPRDTIEMDTTKIFMYGGDFETSSTNMFADGKTKDTILRWKSNHFIIYK
jgi:hypothetical protein